MKLNQAQFAKVVEASKLKAASSPRWIAAIDKAVAGVNNGWIVTELHDGIMVTTESGQTYHANGTCQCKAFQNKQPCKHRALARLIELYNEGLNVPRPRKSWKVRFFNFLSRASRLLGRVFWFSARSARV